MKLKTNNFEVEISGFEEHILPGWLLEAFPYTQWDEHQCTLFGAHLLYSRAKQRDGHDWLTSDFYGKTLLDLYNESGWADHIIQIVYAPERIRGGLKTSFPPSNGDEVLLFVRESKQHSLKVLVATVSGTLKLVK